MKKRRMVKAAYDLTMFVLAFAGTVMICAEGDTIGAQLLAAIGGFGLWGLAWVLWQIRGAVLRQMARKEALRRVQRKGVKEHGSHQRFPHVSA